MELAFLLIVAGSAAAGLLFRRAVSRTAGRASLWLGVVTLCLGLGTMSLVVGRAIGMWTAVGVAIVLFLVAAVTLPFGLAVSLGRSGGSSAGTRPRL